MKIKDEKKWASYVKGNTDAYGSAVLEYAQCWADAMEASMASGERLFHIAEKCEPQGHGISGFQYHAAAITLRDVWEHSVEFIAWYNHAKGYNGGI